MIFDLVIKNIQHIKSLSFSIDLSKSQLRCLVGKNSAGKTTLIRAIRNIKYTNTFQKTASPLIFNPSSSITYRLGDSTYHFQYNPVLRAIDSKEVIDRNFTKSLFVELPIPHGERFNQYKTLGEIDSALRRNISIADFVAPTELIEFLRRVYKSDRFDSLKETTIKNKKYYFILLKDDFYIREDYFSSGEYFVINLFRMIKSNCKLIVIDEIDISLDAAAQVSLVNELRNYSEAENITVIFTTHSLPLLKTMRSEEIFFLESDKGSAEIFNATYNYVKSVLFGFSGWDKYILTEDICLQRYLQHLIGSDIRLRFSKHLIIYIGGGGNVMKLMNQNSAENFFASPENVITILDGDQAAKIGTTPQVAFLPFANIEHQLDFMRREQREQCDWSFPEVGTYNGPKDLYYRLTHNARISENEIFDFINKNNVDAVEEFRKTLFEFLLAN